jgi:hypothetical protein
MLHTVLYSIYTEVARLRSVNEAKVVSLAHAKLRPHSSFVTGSHNPFRQLHQL